MTRITGLGMKRSYKDAQFNSLFTSGGHEAIAEADRSANDEERPAKKKRKRSKNDVDGVQTSPSIGSEVEKSKILGNKRFAGKFSRTKTDGAPCCNHA